MYYTIETNLTAQEVAELIGNKGRVIAPAVLPKLEVPVGYELRAIDRWDGGKRMPEYNWDDQLWVIVPEGFPKIWGVYFGKATTYTLKIDGAKVERNDLCIPRTFAATEDEAIRDLVPELLDPEGGYNFSY